MTRPDQYVAVNEYGRRIGEDHPRAKYADSTIEAVLGLHELGIPSHAIGGVLKIPASTIRSILGGKARLQTPDRWRKLWRPLWPEYREQDLEDRRRRNELLKARFKSAR